MNAGSFLSGVAVGVVIGALAVYALRVDRSPGATAENSHSTARQSEATSSAPSAPKPAQLTPASASSRSTPPPADSLASIVPSIGASATETAFSSGQRSEAADSVAKSIVEQRARGETLEQMSDKFQAEARDDNWAANMENQLGDYLARFPAPNALGSTTVICRMTVCRITSVVSNEVVSAVPMTDLQFAMFKIPHESLGREVTMAAVTVMGDPKNPTQTVEAAYLRRIDAAADSKP